MVKFIKVVKGLDIFTDGIPVVSTLKNAGILIYQLAHKVNHVVNPVNTSWVDDIKIYALSKSDLVAGVAMIPVVGNLAVLIYQAKVALGYEWPFEPRGYLEEAARGWRYGCEKHKLEIVSLYLARNPNRKEEKLRNALCSAAISSKNKEVFQLILDSRKNWSAETICHVLKSCRSIEITKLVLDEYSDLLSADQVGTILKYQAESKCQEIVEVLFERYPEIDQKTIAAALKNASKNHREEIIRYLLVKIPQPEPELLETLLTDAYKNLTLLNWLLDKYQNQIPTAAIGKVLEKVTPIITKYSKEGDQYPPIVQRLLKEYPDLPAEDLLPSLVRASRYNSKLFEIYLNHFTQLKSQHLQKILDEATALLPLMTEGNWETTVSLIRQKFPEMKPTAKVR